MKVLVTLMTENDKESTPYSKEEIEQAAKRGWELICAMLNTQSRNGETIYVEKCELVEESV